MFSFLMIASKDGKSNIEIQTIQAILSKIVVIVNVISEAIESCIVKVDTEKSEKI